MSTSDSLNATHFGLFVENLEHMKAFYQRVFGFVVTDEYVDPEETKQATFLSRNPAEHHQLVLVSGRTGPAYPTVLQHASFRTTSIAELRGFFLALRRERLPHLDPINHGISWSIYFRDPEENRIEIYAETDWYVTQPFRAPLDLTRTDEQIRSETEALCRTLPGFQPMSSWHRQTSERIRLAIEALHSRRGH